jgi:predicted dehydrogenase
MKTDNRVTRRRFLGGAGATAPLVVPAAVLGLNGAVPPSDRITMAAVGMGARGRYVLGHFLVENDVRVVAVSDCFADRRAMGKEIVDRHYGNKDCVTYRFHEEALDRGDVDAVLIATGDRWHGVLSVLAARAGKDIYSEKPFCLTIAEGRALVETTKRYGTIWQCGTQRKSIPGYRIVVDAVHNGRIGKLHTITTSFGDGGWRQDGFPAPEPEPAPEVFDYDRWLGQAPWAPYSPIRVKLWRLNWDTGAGAIADMGAHYFETAQWAHRSQFSGPVEFEGEGMFREQGGFNNTPYFYNVRARYADGVRLVMDPAPKGVRFDGDVGWIELSDFGEVTCFPASIMSGVKIPRSDWKVMKPHIRNFLDCTKSRKLPVSHPEIAHRAHTIIHCAGICLRLGRKVRWNPEAERFVGDDEANNMLSRTMRTPWRV